MSKTYTITWTTQDVLDQHPHLNEAQATKVLDALFADASYARDFGITWDAISDTVTNLGLD
jgi:hypothetical protein